MPPQPMEEWEAERKKKKRSSSGGAGGGGSTRRSRSRRAAPDDEDGAAAEPKRSRAAGVCCLCACLGAGAAAIAASRPGPVTAAGAPPAAEAPPGATGARTAADLVVRTGDLVDQFEAKIQSLQAAERKAAEAENYDEANRIKQEIVSLKAANKQLVDEEERRERIAERKVRRRELGEKLLRDRIAELTRRKNEAVESERYDEAKKIKKDIAASEADLAQGRLPEVTFAPPTPQPTEASAPSPKETKAPKGSKIGAGGLWITPEPPPPTPHPPTPAPTPGPTSSLLAAPGGACDPLTRRRDCTREAARGYWQQSTKRWSWGKLGKERCGFRYFAYREARTLLEGKRVLFMGGAVAKGAMYAMADVLMGPDAVRRTMEARPGPLHKNDADVLASAKKRGGTGVIMDSKIGAHSGARVTFNRTTSRWGPEEPADMTQHCGVPAAETEADPYLQFGGSGFDRVWDPQNGRVIDRRTGRAVIRGELSARVSFELEFTSNIVGARGAVAEGLNKVYETQHRGVQARHGQWIRADCLEQKCKGPNGWTNLEMSVKPPLIQVGVHIGGRIGEVTRLASWLEKAVLRRQVKFGNGLRFREGAVAIVTVECATPKACRKTWNIYCPPSRALPAPRPDATEFIFQRTDDVGAAMTELAAQQPTKRVTQVGAGADVIVLQADRPADCVNEGLASAKKVLHAVRKMNLDEAWPHKQTAWVWLTPTHDKTWNLQPHPNAPNQGPKLMKCWRDVVADMSAELQNEGHIAVAPATFATHAGMHEKMLHHDSDSSPSFLDTGRTFLANAILNSLRVYWREKDLCSGRRM